MNHLLEIIGSTNAQSNVKDGMLPVLVPFVILGDIDAVMGIQYLPLVHSWDSSS